MCNCIDVVNEKLGPEQYVRTTMTFDGSPSRALVPLMRRGMWSRETRRSVAKDVVANFCPWCGEKYPDAASPPANRTPGAGT